ncbi:MAG: prepilin-type N-terminal cleavage/methylation domain-containing protein [Lentisphaeraceae bacterium]|nr:prepilin-type N-terminal cleavage/methylation domain-containing protein [Lentisphaeraceae bacterium]
MKLNQANKFTLIELLVVVAIIGILASMLLPSISKARKTSQQAVCLNNLKSLGTATQLFMLDGNSLVKPGHYPQKYGWNVHLSRVMGTKMYSSGGEIGKTTGKYWQCPAPERPKWPTPLASYHLSYGMNNFLYKRAQHAITTPSKTVLIGENWGQGVKDHWLTIGRVKAWHSSKVNVVFVDGHAASAQTFLVKDPNMAPYINWTKDKG